VRTGDNLGSLDELLSSRGYQIDLAYLDPPYNGGYTLSSFDDTASDKRDLQWLELVMGGAAQSLSQRDRWLSLVYARLILIERALSTNGAVAASIDSWEVHHLAVLVQEVFGHRGPTRVYAWPHAVQPGHPSHVPSRMNFLLVNAPEHRRCTLPKSVLGSTEEARAEVRKEIGKEIVFDTPKPVRLLRHLVLEHTGSSSIVLDPYAGCGSLGVAVTQANRYDGGSRRCVLMERSEPALEELLARGSAIGADVAVR
jgi:DNA modification methylase